MVEPYFDVVAVGGSIPLMPILFFFFWICMFFIVLPNKKIVKFFSPIMLINLFKYFYNYSFIDFFKINGFIVKKNFFLKINSIVFSYKFDHIIYNKFQIYIAKNLYKSLVSYSIRLFFPFAILSFGESSENGFYYDFELDLKLSLENLKKIEKKIFLLLEQNFSFFIFLFENKNYKNDENLFFLNNYSRDIIKNSQNICIYKCGLHIDILNNFHFDYLNKDIFFKLTNISGAYWMKNSSNIMLQRIEGVVFSDNEVLNNYIFSFKDMKDHRLLGKKYDLFHFQLDTCGMIFWHKDGWVIYQEIIKYLRYIFSFFEYMEVNTPQLINKNLWEMSGHLDKFYDNMYIIFSDNDTFVLKPMNCPAHVQIFKNSIKSYKDLPIKYCEFGSCHRKEFSGALHGIMRVKNFIQDDGHIFCTEDQIQKEVILFIKSLFIVYKKFKFTDILIKLSTRPEKRVGNDIIWDKAEKSLMVAMNKLNLNYLIVEGDGAFYGPKIEFTLKDNISRLWQCGTIQVDFFIPKRLGAYYINRFGNKQCPIMLHRAIIGSIERFLGILLENSFDNFPLWLCPVQVIVLNITINEICYSKKIVNILKKENIRVIFDFKNDKISFKIRNAIMKKIPFFIIIGKSELQDNSVSVRNKNSGNLGVMKVDDFINMFKICLFS